MPKYYFIRNIPHQLDGGISDPCFSLKALKGAKDEEDKKYPPSTGVTHTLVAMDNLNELPNYRLYEKKNVRELTENEHAEWNELNKPGPQAHKPVPFAPGHG